MTEQLSTAQHISVTSDSLSPHVMYIHIYITESLYVHQKLTQRCKSTKTV